MASTNVISQYESEIGYKPESVQKLNAWQKGRGLGLKYGQVKKAFDGMKNNKSSPNRDVVKSKATNMNVNQSKIEVDLVPTPEAEEAVQKKQKNEETKSKNDEQKTWTFDVSKGTETIQMFEKLHKNIKVDKETLSQILEWAKSENINIKMSELKQAYSQRQHAVDSSPKKKKTIKKQKKVEKKEENEQQFEALIELQTMTDYCTNDVIKDLLKIYFEKWNHEPLDAKQLLNFVDEQGLNEKYKDVNFEMLSKYFQQYERYKKDVAVNNEKIRTALNAKRQELKEFDCKEVLNKYVEKHGQPRDVQMFYRYVLEIGYNVEFKQLDEEYNKAQGIKKKKKKKGKVKSTAKQLKNLYKKAKTEK